MSNFNNCTRAPVRRVNEDKPAMRVALPCLRRTEPSAALIPHAGQRTLAYVPAEQSDIRKRMHEFNRSIAARLVPGESTEVFAAEVRPAKPLPLLAA